MRRLVGCCFAVGLLVVSVGVSRGEVGLTLKAGTLGIGADLTVGLFEQLNVRIGGNYFTYTMEDFASGEMDDDEGINEIEEVDAELNLQSVALLVDLHPWKTPVRITGGVIFHNNEVAASDDTVQRVEVSGREYTVSDIRAAVTFENEVAPYIGIGYGNAVRDDSRWHFALDVGAMFHGEPQIDLSATASDPLLQALLDSDIEQEIAEAEVDMGDFTIYPVASVGLSYRF